MDGTAGITYATLQAIYEYFIVLKTKELITKNGRERKLEEQTGAGKKISANHL
jgi:hypothetical protein